MTLTDATAICEAAQRPTMRFDQRIRELDREIARRARDDEDARRLMTIPGIGPITATALLALAPPAIRRPMS